MYGEPASASSAIVYDNTHGESAPSDDMYGEPAPADDTYGEPAPAEDMYGEPAPAEDMYGEPAPADDVYGEPAPADDVYGEPAPTYGEMAPTDDMYGDPTPAPPLAASDNMYGEPVQAPAASAGADGNMYGESAPAGAVYGKPLPVPRTQRQPCAGDGDTKPTRVERDGAGRIQSIDGEPLNSAEALEYRTHRTSSTYSTPSTVDTEGVYGEPLPAADVSATQSMRGAVHGQQSRAPMPAPSSSHSEPTVGDELYGFSVPKSIPPPRGHASAVPPDAEETYDALPPSNRASFASMAASVAADGEDADDIYGFCEPRATQTWRTAMGGDAERSPAVHAVPGQLTLAGVTVSSTEADLTAEVEVKTEPEKPNASEAGVEAAGGQGMTGGNAANGRGDGDCEEEEEVVVVYLEDMPEYANLSAIRDYYGALGDDDDADSVPEDEAGGGAGEQQPVAASS
jgi:hypothetical protein